MSELFLAIKSIISRVGIRSRSKLFDEEYYRISYPDVAAAGVDPYNHFLRYGIIENRQPNELFNPQYYLSQVGSPVADPTTHYLRTGAKLGFDPHPVFDTKWYLETYPDVRRAGINPLLHYLRSGRREGRRTSPEYRKAFGARMPAAMGYTFPVFKNIRFGAADIEKNSAKYHERIVLPLYLGEFSHPALVEAVSITTSHGIVPIEIQLGAIRDPQVSACAEFTHAYIEFRSGRLKIRYQEIALFRIIQGTVSFMTSGDSGAVELCI